MHQKHIKIIIRADGACSVDAVNFTDATCQQATDQIMRALAGQVTADRLKLEAQRLPPQANNRREAAR
jgi:hypothetical protein